MSNAPDTTAYDINNPDVKLTKRNVARYIIDTLDLAGYVNADTVNIYRVVDELRCAFEIRTLTLKARRVNNGWATLTDLEWERSDAQADNWAARIDGFNPFA